MHKMIMKKLLLILCQFARTAHAEWKYDGNTDTFTGYIGYSRVRTGDLFILGIMKGVI